MLLSGSVGPWLLWSFGTAGAKDDHFGEEVQSLGSRGADVARPAPPVILNPGVQGQGSWRIPTKWENEPGSGLAWGWETLQPSKALAQGTVWMGHQLWQQKSPRMDSPATSAGGMEELFPGPWLKAQRLWPERGCDQGLSGTEYDSRDRGGKGAGTKVRGNGTQGRKGLLGGCGERSYP